MTISHHAKDAAEQIGRFSIGINYNYYEDDAANIIQQAIDSAKAEWEGEDLSWKQGDLLVCENDIYHFVVRFQNYAHLDKRSFYGEVIKSIAGGHLEGDCGRFRSSGFRRLNTTRQDVSDGV